jgi:anti-sigma factor RsiW
MNHLTQEALIDYLHGELAPGEDAAVLLHLEGCAACRTEYEAQAQLSEALRAYASMTDVELPGQVRAAIWNRIEEAQRSSWRARVYTWMRPAAGFALATAAAVVIAIGVVPRHAGPAIDAMYYLEDHAALTSSVPFHEGSAVPSSLVTGVVMNDQQWLASSGAGDVAVDALAH